MTERIAVFGGVYSNYLALVAACRDALARGAQSLYCLGDLGAFGPHPERVFPILESYRVTTILGNYEESLSSGRADCNCGYTDPRDNHFAQISYDYTNRNTSDSAKKWMATLPAMLRLEFGGRKVLMAHGSPRRINEFLWYSTSPVAFLSRMLGEHRTELLLVTHTGLHWRRSLPGGRDVVNVGAIGRPPNNGRTAVYYTLLTHRDGLEVEFVPVVYDFERLAREMRAERLPEEFVETILTGWWTTCLEILPAKERAAGRF
ncbi:MAG: metallophosphoesterase family protein [Acidobacteria bacterium]|nr:metallophosphoesterase family protein [Acidobacteriota bacterium]